MTKAKANRKVTFVPIETLLAPFSNGAVLHQGWSPQCKKEPSPSEEKWGVLKTTSIQPGVFRDHENKLLPDHLVAKPQYEVMPGDLLITCAGPRSRCGVACLVRKTRNRLMISGKMYRFRPNPKMVTPEYLEMFLQSRQAWKAIDEMKTGGNESGLNLTHTRFKDLKVPIVPIDEQERMVAKLEVLFSELDAGVESLKKARAQLKTFRQAVLKSAFEGRLTNDNVSDGELPKSWKRVLLPTLTEKISDGPFGSHLKSVDYIDQGVRVIRLENIGVLKFKDELLSFVSEEKYQTISNHTVTKGDIIFSSFIVGETRVAILPEHIERAINKSDCFLVRVSPTQVSNKYLAFFLATKENYNQLVNQIHGATRPRINTTQLKSSLVPICSLEEQHRVVDEIESRLSVCDKLEEAIDTGLKQSEALRQSILKLAFEGRLVPQNQPF